MNRVGDRYVDQCRLSGHHDRIADLDLFAELGITAIRYPLLWERVAPEDPGRYDWHWCDERLNRLRSLGIAPIAGLVHHGSGPRYTHLLDDEFAAKLGRYAARVAERYPWIEDWTPINEPLTTARFSALYGHWYPHAHSEAAFWRVLLNQIDGVRAAMQAVRRVNPAARLVQTDDLGRTYATDPLRDQAAFDNLRRWAGWDLLFGRVTRDHPLWERLARLGLGDRLRAIADAPCPPDIIGVNHYLTSDRFLDHRIQCYPPHSHGGNGTSAYADVEAVRLIDPPPAGLAGALRDAWERYGVPLAITEVHNGCTREEQLRWAAEAWDTAVALRAEGVDVRAVTAWSLLGSHGWDTLLTRPGSYEPGVFDVSGGEPRPTALAALWKGLAAGAPRHPVAQQPGWWRRPDRLIYPPLVRTAPLAAVSREPAGLPLLVCGANGELAAAFERVCRARGIRLIVTASFTLPAKANGDAVSDQLPWGVIAIAPTDTSLAEACQTRGVDYLALGGDQPGDGVEVEEIGAGTRHSMTLVVQTDPQAVPDPDHLAAAALDTIIDRAGCTSFGNSHHQPAAPLTSPRRREAATML